MADFPLIVFPSPKLTDRETRGQYRREDSQDPIHKDQCKRLSPRFETLQREFDKRRVELQRTAAGVEPEKCLVIETMGSVEKFTNAVKKIKGLEWMAELNDKEIDSDQDLYSRDMKERKITLIYMVMTNQEGLRQIISLWKLYKKDENVNFEHGLAQFKELFKHVIEIRYWSLQDRLKGVSLEEFLKERRESSKDNRISCEIELWFRNSTKKQKEVKEQIEKDVKEMNGKIVDECILMEIRYHTLIAEIPVKNVERLKHHPEIELFKCDHIMYFCSAGQMATDSKPEKGLLDRKVDDPEPDFHNEDPIVAILDGYPFAEHNWIKNRIIIDDPGNFESCSPRLLRRHGTAMSGLVIHGECDRNQSPLSRPVYFRPIMKPTDSPLNGESTPDGLFLVDFIHQAVRRMFEVIGCDKAIAPSVRIINLSIGEENRPFCGIMNPLAKLLDWLSEKYRILFVISAGNHSEKILYGKETEIVQNIYMDMRYRKLLSPAESINNLTVGALHCDSSSSTPKYDHHIDPFPKNMPSPISPFGSGYRGAIKPDLVYDGGRVFYSRPITGRLMSPNSYISGMTVVSPGQDQGSVMGKSKEYGTSNAAALVSRMAAQCYDYLISLFREQASNIDPDQFVTPLLKAMVIHGCSWEWISDRLFSILKSDHDRRKTKLLMSRWIGYGKPCIERVLRCNESRATFLGFGYLNNERKAHLFEVPFPDKLKEHRVKYLLTVTLAWLSPVAANTQRYRMVKMWFDFVEKNGYKSQNVSVYEATRGTVQHQIFDLGTVKNIVDPLKIRVNCKEDAGKFEGSASYGLAVTLERADPVLVDIVYEECRAAIRTPIPIRM